MYVVTVKGARKVAIMMKRGGGMMQEHMLTMINDSNLIDHTHPEERGEAPSNNTSNCSKIVIYLFILKAFFGCACVHREEKISLL